MYRLFTKSILITALISFTSNAFAQNLPYVDSKPIHLGFSLGFNSMDFGVMHSYQTIDGKKYYADVSSLKPGFSVGIISDLRLNDHFNLRLTPSLHFADRSLTYNVSMPKVDPNGGDSILLMGDRNITSIPVCVPLFIKYSADRRDNYRPYLICGGGMYFDLGRNKTNAVLLNAVDFYSEFGVGCDLYFSFFKLSPELKFAVGMNNMLVPIDQRLSESLSNDEKKFTNALASLASRILTLTFNFE